MRGKDRFVIDVYTEVRITPAHAGKRLAAPDARRTVWDHPRACGEKHSCINLGQHKRGSPPRMRGKGGWKNGLKKPLGITPAHAGKRGGGQRVALAHGDHPRACGEKTPADVEAYRVKGSPPRMRGKGGLGPILPGHRGDHPRACGEK